MASSLLVMNKLKGLTKLIIINFINNLYFATERSGVNLLKKIRIFYLFVILIINFIEKLI